MLYAYTENCLESTNNFNCYSVTVYQAKPFCHSELLRALQIEHYLPLINDITLAAEGFVHSH